MIEADLIMNFEVLKAILDMAIKRTREAMYV
jgi:hypothetical protein